MTVADDFKTFVTNLDEDDTAPPEIWDAPTSLMFYGGSAVVARLLLDDPEDARHLLDEVIAFGERQAGHAGYAERPAPGLLAAAIPVLLATLRAPADLGTNVLWFMENVFFAGAAYAVKRLADQDNHVDVEEATATAAEGAAFFRAHLQESVH